jgi:Rieske Fe-S protein
MRAAFLRAGGTPHASTREVKRIMKRSVTRRAAFLQIAGMGILVTAFRSFGFLGLFGKKQKGLEPDADGAVRLSLGDEKYRPLNETGGALKVDIRGMGKPVIVIRKDKDTVLAVSSKCTHLGCEVDLPENGTIDCHCHGSEFKTDGTVIKGPAKQNLPEFKALLDKDTVIIFI